MDCLYLPRVQDVAGEEGDYEEDDQDGQRPRCEDLLLACLWFVYSGALDMGGEHGGRGLEETDRPGLRRLHLALQGKLWSVQGVLPRSAAGARTEQLVDDGPAHNGRHAGLRALLPWAAGGVLGGESARAKTSVWAQMWLLAAGCWLEVSVVQPGMGCLLRAD